MNSCSNYTILRHDDAPDTNVVSVEFKILKDAINKLHQGDPVSCQSCNAILNKYSTLQKESCLLIYIYLNNLPLIPIIYKNNNNCGFVSSVIIKTLSI